MIQPVENELELSYDEEIEAVLMQWKGFLSSGSFHEANEKVLSLLKTKNSSKIVADLRNMKIIKLADQEWLSKSWFPRIIKAGLSVVAIVESDDYFNRLTVRHITETVNDQIIVKNFSTYLGARNWIRNQ